MCRLILTNRMHCRWFFRALISRAKWDEPSPAGEVDYGSIVFVGDWTDDQWKAHSRLSRLLSGQEKVGGYEINYVFPQSNVARDFYFGVGGCPTWRITSHIIRDSVWKEFYPPQVPLLAHNLKPFLTPAHAVNQWIFGVDHSLQAGASFQHQWELLTLVPDLRAKLISAEWIPGTLGLNLDLRVPVDQVQLQIIHAGAAVGHQLQDAKAGEQQLEIPDDAQKLSIFVVARTGECVAQLHLGAIYQCYGKAKSEAEEIRRSRTDLAGGETDTVEFKPFMVQKDLKESEFVRTVIAFANTYGGRVYVGANDDGTVQANTEACRIFQCNVADALAQQVSRLKSLIREKVKPVPAIDIRQIAFGADSVVVAEVQRGVNPPYATHQNQIYIRRGATTRAADPTELRALFSANDSYFSRGMFSN